MQHCCKKKNKDWLIEIYLKFLFDFDTLASFYYLFIMKQNTTIRTFSDAAYQQADSILLKDEYFKNRKEVFGITIDPVSSQDLDDAFWIRTVDDIRNIIQLSIHTADVSSLIPIHSSLDKEGYHRLQSFYDKKDKQGKSYDDPLFPQNLSSYLMSLIPDEKRLTMSIDVDIDMQKRKILSVSDPYQSCIVSFDQLSYESAYQHMIDKNSLYHGMLRDAAKIAKLIHKERMQTSKINFSFRKQITQDQDGNIQSVSYPTQKIIHEFMLLKNKTIAEFFESHHISGIFRNHYASLVHRHNNKIVKGKECITYDKKPVIDITLKNYKLKQRNAFYGAENQGHFDLGLSSYMHFTSPIRRYPDIINHRILIAYLLNYPIPYSSSELGDLSRYFTRRIRFND